MSGNTRVTWIAKNGVQPIHSFAESLFVGIITTGNMREFVLYTSDEAAAVAKAAQLAKEIKTIRSNKS